MEEHDLEGMIRAYLQAFEARELSRCLAFFSEDAAIQIEDSLYHSRHRGRQAIEEWHKERFMADMRIVEVEELKIGENEVVVDGVISSKTLKAWNIDRLNGTVTFLFQLGKIKEAKFALGMHNPELWRV